MTFIVNHTSYYLSLRFISDRHSVEQLTFFKFVDQKPLVKRRWSYDVRITVYMWALLIESLPDTKSQIFHWKHFARHSFSLIGGIRLSPRTSKTSESTVSLSITEQWTITEIRRQSNSVLTYSLLTDVLQCLKTGLERASVNWSNLLISKAYFPANKMNCMKRVKEK